MLRIFIERIQVAFLSLVSSRPTGSIQQMIFGSRRMIRLALISDRYMT